MENILAFLNNIAPLSEEEISEIKKVVYQVELAKGERFLSYGETEKRIGFMEDGLLEMTFVENNSETIIDFLFPGDFACDYLSFLSAKPSDTQIEAIRKAKLFCFDKSNLDRLYGSSINFQKIGRIIAENYYVEFAQRLRTQHLSPKQKYERLQQHYPKFIQEIPQYKIASYLGVSAEWLSKIRAKK